MNNLMKLVPGAKKHFVRDAISEYSLEDIYLNGGSGIVRRSCLEECDLHKCIRKKIYEEEKKINRERGKSGKD